MMDPTPVRLKSDAKRGSTKEACLWTYRALDGPVFFEFAEGKHGTTPANTLEHYKGRLQTDGASNFGGVPSHPDIQHLNCWAHVRRYFVKAEENAAPGAGDYLNVIDRLFRRERIIRRFRLKPESVLELRRRFSLPEVDELFEKSANLRANRAHGQNSDAQGDPLPARPHRTAARMFPARAVTDRQ